MRRKYEKRKHIIQNIRYKIMKYKIMKYETMKYEKLMKYKI